jgi:hypothetical protein
LWIERLISTFIVIAGLDPAIQGPPRAALKALDPRVKPEDDNKIEQKFEINTLWLLFV